MATKRQIAVRKAIRGFIPLAPLADVEPVEEHALRASMKTLPPAIAAWLAVTAHVRHAHTEYDRMLDEGYDRDSARHFVRDDMQDVLTRWGCRRTLTDDD